LMRDAFLERPKAGRPQRARLRYRAVLILHQGTIIGGGQEARLRYDVHKYAPPGSFLLLSEPPGTNAFTGIVLRLALRLAACLTPPNLTRTHWLAHGCECEDAVLAERSSTDPPGSRLWWFGRGEVETWDKAWPGRAAVDPRTRGALRRVVDTCDTMPCHISTRIERVLLAWPCADECAQGGRPTSSSLDLDPAGFALSH
jgi:hypothetical protein